MDLNQCSTDNPRTVLRSGNAAPRLAEVAEVVFVRTAAVLAGLRCKDRWRQLVRWFSSERRQVT